LNDNNQVANGNYDFEFKLFTALTGGTQDGTSREVLNVAVSNGVFTVLVDFGAGAFPGADRFLEIAIRPAGGGAFTTLTPRQQITLLLRNQERLLFHLRFRHQCNQRSKRGDTDCSDRHQRYECHKREHGGQCVAAAV
jgi:hypothetical protein